MRKKIIVKGSLPKQEPCGQKNGLCNPETVDVIGDDKECQARGKYVFCMGNRVRLISCEHNELPPSLEQNREGTLANYLRHSCVLEVETVPPNRLCRSFLYYVLKAEVRLLPSDKFEIPQWNTPYELTSDIVFDVLGGEWIIESFHEDITELGGEKPVQKGKDTASEARRQVEPTTPLAAEPSQPLKKPMSKKEKAVRTKGGKSRALIEKKDESNIFERWNKCRADFSNNSKADITAKWCEAEGVLRKDGERITPRNILELVRRKRPFT